MRRVTVTIQGKDGRIHKLETDATSLYEAVHQMVQQFNRLWWWSSSALVTVQSGDEHWQVDQAKVRKWRQEINKAKNIS